MATPSSRSSYSQQQQQILQYPQQQIRRTSRTPSQPHTQATGTAPTNDFHPQEQVRRTSQAPSQPHRQVAGAPSAAVHANDYYQQQQQQVRRTSQAPSPPQTQAAVGPAILAQAPDYQQQQPVRRTSHAPNQPQGHGVAPANDYYDVVWSSNALGLRFTPSELSEPVICQITAKPEDAVRQTRAAVGDTLVALQVHSRNSAMAPVATMRDMVHIFQNEELPFTLRFKSRAQEVPEPIALVDISCSYTHKWAQGDALGVSLAMDPCSLHSVITAIDSARISPDFLVMEPHVGDILISIRDIDKKVDLDQMRFEKVIECLRKFPRPCKLTFARLHEELVPSPKSNSSEQPSASCSSSSSSSSSAAVLTSTGAQYQQQLQYPQPPQQQQQLAQSTQSPAHYGSLPPPPAADPRFQQRQPRRPAPLKHRQSFNVDEIKRSKAAAKVKREDRFYKVEYTGGSLGLVMKDARKDLKGKPKKNGYYALIKQVSKKSGVAGLETASPGDELVAIGQRDLQHVSFDDVQRAISAIRAPTQLIFQRKPQANGSVGSSLVDGLLLFLI